MVHRYLFPFFSIALLLLTACTSSRTASERPETEAPAGQPGVQPEAESAPPELPFSLTIGDSIADMDLEIAVPEGQALDIHLVSEDEISGSARVVHPDGVSIPLGEWHNTEARFVHEFPYGESHLIIEYGEEIYDFLVVAEVAEPEAAATNCENAFMTMQPGARWEYEETIGREYPSRWVYRVDTWTVDADGNVDVTLVVERLTGVEGNVDRVTFLELECVQNVIYIIEAVQREGQLESTTEYEPGTVYLPESILEGTSWQRRGSLEMRGPDRSESYTITETLTCVAHERISVRAGEFDAYKVEFTIEGMPSAEGEPLSHRGASWYVPGIGRVLSIGESDDAPRLELLSYEGVEPG